MQDHIQCIHGHITFQAQQCSFQASTTQLNKPRGLHAFK
jgi:hypothetical protein